MIILCHVIPIEMWKDSKTTGEGSGSGRRETVRKSSSTASWLSRLESGLKRVICYSCTHALSWMYASPVRGESRAQQHANIRMKCKFVLALEGETDGILNCCLLFSQNVVNIIRVPLCPSWYQGWEIWQHRLSGGLVELSLKFDVARAQDEIQIQKICSNPARCFIKIAF